jgi:hypothetical protein
MLFLAAILLFLVGLVHSVLGEKNLIHPLFAQEDFPVVLGSQRNGRLTLWFGWHALTLFWWAQASLLTIMALDIENAAQTTLIALAIACGLLGLVALIGSKGKHLSCVFFLPLAGILGWEYWVFPA